MQADAEALLLMRTFKLKHPPIYTWQFADKDVPRWRFKFPRVYQAINKYVELWKGLKSPNITGYCPQCQIKDACLGWHFARADKLAEEEIVRRKAASNLSRTVREEIADTDRRNVYVSFGDAKERQGDRWAIRDKILFISFFLYFFIVRKSVRTFTKENDGINDNKEISFDSNKKRDPILFSSHTSVE